MTYYFFLKLGIHFELNTVAFRVTCYTKHSKESFLGKVITFVLTIYIEYRGIKTEGGARSKNSQDIEANTEFLMSSCMRPIHTTLIDVQIARSTVIEQTF